MKNLLIVEDQKYPLMVLEGAVKSVGTKYFPGMKYDVARCYNDAERMIQKGYNVVLLDHRLPRENMGNLEDTDFRRFSDSLENIGYSLIGSIREYNPKTIVIGTSSLSAKKLRGQPVPDHVMSKMFGEAERDLGKILDEIIK